MEKNECYTCTTNQCCSLLPQWKLKCKNSMHFLSTMSSLKSARALYWAVEEFSTLSSYLTLFGGNVWIMPNNTTCEAKFYVRNWENRLPITWAFRDSCAAWIQCSLVIFTMLRMRFNLYLARNGRLKVSFITEQLGLLRKKQEQTKKKKKKKKKLNRSTL